MSCVKEQFICFMVTVLCIFLIVSIVKSSNEHILLSDSETDDGPLGEFASCAYLESSENTNVLEDPPIPSIKTNLEGDCSIYALAVTNYWINLSSKLNSAISLQEWYDYIADCGIRKGYFDAKGIKGGKNGPLAEECKAELAKKAGNPESFLINATTYGSGLNPLVCPPLAVGDKMLVVLYDPNGKGLHAVSCEITSCDSDGGVVLNCIDRNSRRNFNDPVKYTVKVDSKGRASSESSFYNNLGLKGWSVRGYIMPTRPNGQRF